MGVVLNPVAYRVGYKYSWKDAWYSHRLTYSVFVHDVLAFKALLLFIFYRYFSYRRAFWLYSHTNIYIFNNKIFVNLYLYDSNEVQMFYNLSKRYKKIGWYRLNSISGWFKGHFLDRKSRVKRFHFFTRALRFLYDILVFEDFRYVLRKDRRTVFKLKEMHNKKTIYPLSKDIKIYYNKKLKSFRIIDFNLTYSKGIWLPWEEIKPYRLPVRNMVFHTNHLSVKWWVNRFNLFYKKSIKKILNNEKVYIKKNLKSILKKKRKFEFKEKKNSKMTKKRYFRKFAKRIKRKNIQWKRDLDHINIFKNKRRFSKSFLNKKNLYFQYVKSNNRLLFTFLACCSKLFSSLTYIYDRKIFMRKWVRKVIRFFAFFFLKKNILKIYGKLVEYIASCLDLNVNVKVYALNNNSVGATFISRYIAIGLRSKFDYLDMMIPIRKNLRKQMYVRKYSKFNLDKPGNYRNKEVEIIAHISTLRDIFYFRMQRINNFLKYKREYKEKYKFFYLNFKLLNTLEFIKKQVIILNKFDYNIKNVKNIESKNIKLVQKFIYKLCFFNLKFKSGFLFKFIELFFIKRKIKYIFYGPIWYKEFLFKYIFKIFNKKMFFYYCSFFIKKIKVKNFRFLSFINFVLFLKSNVKLKKKYHMKYLVYFLLKDKYNYFYEFFLNYFCFYLKKFRKNKYLMLLKKKKIVKKKKIYLCKRLVKGQIRYSRKLKKILKNKILKKKHKLKKVLKKKNSKNSKSSKKYFYLKKKNLRYVLFKKNIIINNNNSNIFFKFIKNYFYKNSLYLYSNTYNNFILNSFYDKKESFSYLCFYNKKKYKFLIFYLKKFREIIKYFNLILKKKKKYELKKIYFKKLSSSFKSLFELFDIDKSILFDRIETKKIRLLFKNKIINPSQLINFSLFNLILIYKFFFKYIKNININLKYYNLKFKYLKKIKNIQKKKNELRHLNLYSLIRFYNKIFFLIKYFIKKKNILNININSLINYNNKYYNNKLLYNNILKFKKITSFLTHDRTKNMFFFYFNNIYNFDYKYHVNVLVLKKKLAYVKLFLSRDWDKPRVPNFDEEIYIRDNNKVPVFLYNKVRRMKFFDDNLAILYGYKFHFVGRFTRKQKAANLWYRLGALANASAVANVDYAIYSVVMRYSVCTVKVWLYKSRKAPKYKYRVF